MLWRALLGIAAAILLIGAENLIAGETRERPKAHQRQEQSQRLKAGQGILRRRVKAAGGPQVLGAAQDHRVQIFSGWFDELARAYREKDEQKMGQLITRIQQLKEWLQKPATALGEQGPTLHNRATVARRGRVLRRSEAKRTRRVAKRRKGQPRVLEGEYCRFCGAPRNKGRDGEPLNTGRSLDIAISGVGLLQVTLPTGDVRYTRDGSLEINENGDLVTTAGFPIEPAITIPLDAVAVNIARDGGVVVTDSSGAQAVVGNLQLARFLDTSRLVLTGDNLLAESEASGPPTIGTPGEDYFGTIRSGYLENFSASITRWPANFVTMQQAGRIRSLPAAAKRLRHGRPGKRGG